jgi:hypothetical protein
VSVDVASWHGHGVGASPPQRSRGDAPRPNEEGGHCQTPALRRPGRPTRSGRGDSDSDRRRATRASPEHRRRLPHSRDSAARPPAIRGATTRRRASRHPCARAMTRTPHNLHGTRGAHPSDPQSAKPRPESARPHCTTNTRAGRAPKHSKHRSGPRRHKTRRPGSPNSIGGCQSSAAHGCHSAACGGRLGPHTAATAGRPLRVYTPTPTPTHPARRRGPPSHGTISAARRMPPGPAPPGPQGARTARPPRRRGPPPPPPPPPEPLSRPPRAYGGGGGGGGGGGQAISAGLGRHAVGQLQVVFGQLRRPVAARRLDKRAPAPRPAPRRRKRQSRPRAGNGRLLGAGPRRHGPATTAGLPQAPVRRGRRSRGGDRTRGRWPRGCRTATGRQ